MENIVEKEVNKGSEITGIIYLEEPPAGRLKLFDLYTIALGGAVGAGVVSFTGVALGMTGITMWLAYILGIILGVVTNIPYLIIGSSLRLGGGEYSTIGALLNEKYAGMYALGKLLYPIYFGTYGVSFASYILSIVPGLNAKLVGVLFVATFFIINCFGINASSKTQNIMFIFLIIGLASFIIIGFPKIVNPVFDFSDPSQFTNGAKGFINAIVMLAASCQAYNIVTQFGKDANNAKKDVPRAMLFVVPSLIILYGGCGLVASGILPLSETANQPLTYTARAIMPTWMFVLFIIGVLMAITTTLNGILVGTMNLLSQSADNGWLPKIASKKNKYGVPVAILAFECICASVPILTGFNIATITRYLNLINPLLGAIFTIAVFQLPKKYPNSWKKSMFNVPTPLFNIILCIVLIAQAFMLYNSLTTLDIKIVIFTILLFAFLMIYASNRSKKQVKAEISVWE